MSNTRKALVGGVVLAAVILLVVWIDRPEPPDPPATEELLGLAEIQAMFDSAGGWIALPVADSKYEAGAIIQVAEGSGVRPISHLRECRYPEEVLAPRVGLLPSLRTQRALAVDLGFVGAIRGVRLGPQGQRARFVGVQIDSITSESFDPLRLAIWEEEGTNYDLVPEACRRQLQQPNTFVVSEAARVNRGTYTFYDSAGSRLEVASDQLGEFVDVDAGAEARVSADGRVVIASPVTVAIRRAWWAGDGFEVLGPEAGETPTADSTLRALVQAATRRQAPPP